MKSTVTQPSKPKEPIGTKIKSAFVKFGQAFKRGCINCGKSIKNAFVNGWYTVSGAFVSFHRRFVEGSIGTKLSYFIMGSGNISHKQYIKGFIFLALQVLFFVFMIVSPEIQGNGAMVPMGFKALINLQLGGTEPIFDHIYDSEGDMITVQRPGTGADSVLMLLFGILSIIVVLGYILLWIMNTKSSYASDVAVKEGKKPNSFVDDCKDLLDSKFHILMLTPTCIAALLFTALPTIFMISMAFTTYNQFDMSSAEPAITLFHWNGMQNFIDIFNTSSGSTLGNEISHRFLPILGWTFIWAIFATFTCYFGGILLALLINKKGLKGKKFFRTIFILTIAIPQFMSLLAIRNLLASSGPVNQMLLDWGWISKSIPFLGGETIGNNPHLAKAMVIIINMWLGIPYTMLMTSGILMNIPTDLYEAARVDGTSKSKMFFKITLPYVIFVTTPYLISSFIGNINSFNTIFLLTSGGPEVPGFKGGETDLLVTWLYKLTVENGDYNTGAVIGIFTFIITATITLIAYRRSKAYKEEDTFQ